jgi:phosphoglycerol transferase MdoB-like AlkP superfamily enzyme
VLLRLARRMRWARWIVATAAPALLYVALLLFTVASLEVTRVYGEPLDVQKLRSADNLMVMRGSLRAYLGAVPLILMALGLALPACLGRPLARSLARRRWPTSAAGLWGLVIGLAGFLCAAEAIGLRGIDTVGVKDNAVVFFLKNYKPQPGKLDLAAMEQRLAQQIAGRGDPSRAPSLLDPQGKLDRDFPNLRNAARGFNLLLIQMESTSAPHINPRTAPNITALAQHGLSFSRHLTSVTYTSRSSYSIYYSDYLPRFESEASQVYGRAMPQPALGQVLKSGGYQTALFNSSFLDYVDLRFLFTGKGFDTIVGAREMVSGGGPLFRSDGVAETLTVDRLIAWIKGHQGQRFAAAYMSLAPHHPYEYPPEDEVFPGGSWADRYHNSLHYADRAVGRLIAYLKNEGLLEKTLIVIFGDHGETVSTYPVGHGLNVSAEELYTPFIISNPVLFPQALTSQLPSSHPDIAPAIVGMLGLRAPPQWVGRDLLADQIPARLDYATVMHIHKIALRDGKLLYVWDQSRDKGEMFELNGYAIQPLAPSDRRLEMLPRYRAQAQLFDDWNMQHHLKQALEVKRQSAPAELLHTVSEAKP